MRHRQAGKHFSRTPAHRLALFRNLSRALITHERIVTTLPKAKALRPFIEKLITLAKKAAIADSRLTKRPTIVHLVSLGVIGRFVPPAVHCGVSMKSSGFPERSNFGAVPALGKTQTAQ